MFGFFPVSFKKTYRSVPLRFCLHTFLFPPKDKKKEKKEKEQERKRKGRGESKEGRETDSQ